MEDIYEGNEDEPHIQDAREVMLTNPPFVDPLDPDNHTNRKLSDDNGL